MKIVTEKEYNLMTKEQQTAHEVSIRTELIEVGLIKPEEKKEE